MLLFQDGAANKEGPKFEMQRGECPGAAGGLGDERLQGTGSGPLVPVVGSAGRSRASPWGRTARLRAGRDQVPGMAISPVSCTAQSQ